MGNRHGSLGLWLVSVVAALALAGCVTVIPVGPDADGDGVPDAEDICPGFDDNVDADADGVPDGCDPCPLDNPGDSDGDGVCDSDDICPGGDDSIDGDGDGIPDSCDPCPLDNPDDTDGDGVCDSDDICPGFDDTIDADGDGIPDGCDPVDTIDFDWPEGVPDLGAWLEGHPAVADALVWEGDVLDPAPEGTCGRYVAGPFCGDVMGWPWQDEMQAALFGAFVRAWLGEPSGADDAPPNAADTSDGDEYGHQEYSPEDGMAAFLAYAANSLAVEIGNHHEERPGHMVEVGWSILSPEYAVAPESGFHAGVTPLAVLLDSRQFFYRQPNGNLKVSMVAHGGMATMSAPETATAFLRSTLDDPGLGDGSDAYHCRASIGAFDCSATLPLLVSADAPTETIARTIHWFRINAIHFANHWWYGNAEAHWRYRGYTPAVRIMTGTARTEYVSEGDRRPTSADARIIPRTAGCWGTTGFMRTVLRSVNIPLVLETVGGHALPSFPTEANAGRPSHMSHGDDPYSALTKTSVHPTSALLMDKALWESWFFPPPAPGEPEPELLEPTNDSINEGFLDDLPDDLDYCGDETDCYTPAPQPEPDPTGGAIENTPKLNVGRRTREMTLSWTSWYVVNKYCEVVEAGGGEVGMPVEGSEIALRNWSADDLSSLDCSALPETGREDLFCHEDFFGYLGEVIDGEGGCSEVVARQTHDESSPTP